jgi:UDP-N-acetylglucosamine--N-acetylmuramyl-(pentapeptide) pyrophosphoryl-undecaprenol N-acetylglucosamine transferase
MTILYSGGGTLGSVSPLISVHTELMKRADYHGVWIGLAAKKEHAFIAGREFEEHTIVSPRFRNFEGQGLSLTMLTFPFRFFWAFVQSVRVIRAAKPQAHFSAGSFVSIPVALACFVLRVPNVVHQQDLLPGLANRVMARLASTVTVAFPVLAKPFGKKAVVVGNPVRAEVLGGEAIAAAKKYGFVADKPTVMVIGGSSGAIGLNDMTRDALPELLKIANVLHMTGMHQEHAVESGEAPREGEGRYRPVEFLGAEIGDAYALADIVISRAGLSTMTELGALGKPTILVPIPGSHQMENARYFEAEGAALVVDQDSGSEKLLNAIRTIFDDLRESERLSRNVQRLFPRDAAVRIGEVLAGK